MEATIDNHTTLLQNHHFEVGFSMAFFIYGLCLFSMPEAMSLSTLAPVGFLLILFNLAPGLKTVNLILALPAGFFLGWVIRKLWERGTIARIVLVIFLLLNSFLFYYLVPIALRD